MVLKCLRLTRFIVPEDTLVTILKSVSIVKVARSESKASVKGLEANQS